MHPIASLMVATTFADRLSLSQSLGASRFDLAFEPLNPGDTEPMGVVDWPLEKDLGFRAHQAMEQWVGRKLPVTVTLRKRIPAGAGLGGGSGNAAGMLVGLNQLFQLGATTEQLATIARKLGSDVVYLVHAMQGRPAAMVTGLGDVVQPVDLRTAQTHLTLIFPGFGCPTGAVYKAFDEMAARQTTPPVADEARVRAMADAPVIRPEMPFNDLAAPACVVQPRLAQARQQAQDAAGKPVHINGSGSAMYVIADHAGEAADLARRIRDAADLRTLATVTAASGSAG
ncbi:MAG: hypothetical protein IT440_04405 [Phycisphaeraceae bacterium]|nr:hypothetical protein [Phycisphaeraceae bacterium]